MPKRKVYNPDVLEKMKELDEVKKRGKELRSEIKELLKSSDKQNKLNKEFSLTLTFD